MVSRAAWPVLAPALLLAIALHFAASPAAALPAWLMTLLLFYLFRDPDRIVPPSPLAVVSPVDGRVMAVEQAVDPFHGGPATRIVLEMSWLGTYVTRSPVEGDVMEFWYVPPGGAAPAGETHAASKKDYAYFAMWLRTDERDDVTLALSGSLLRHRVSCPISVGSRIGQGQRCGSVRFPVRVEMFVPPRARIVVTAGERVRSGSHILATFIH